MGVTTVGGVVMTRHGMVDYNTFCLDSAGNTYANGLYSRLQGINPDIVTALGSSHGRLYADDVAQGSCKRCIATITPLDKAVGGVHPIHTFTSGNGLNEFINLQGRVQAKETWTVICVRISDYNDILNHMGLPSVSSATAYQYFYDAVLLSDGTWEMNAHATNQSVPPLEQLLELERTRDV